MKVLIFADAYPSSDFPIANIFTHQQALALKKRNINIAVLHIDLRSARRIRPLGFYRDDFGDITVYRMAIPIGPFPKLLKYIGKLAAIYAFKKIRKCFGMPDIVHAHFALPGYWGSAIRQKNNIKLVTTEHGTNIARESMVQQAANTAKAAYMCSDYVIAVGSYLKQCMQKLVNRDIDVIPNIINEVFTYNKGAKNEAFSVISIGHLIERKGFDITIRAFSKFVDIYPDSKLTIVGEGILKQELLALVIELGLQNNVEFVGIIHNEKLPEVYSRHHVFMLASRLETFGVVYAEAAACGLPIIATDCGGPRDIVTEHNGIMIPKDDIDAAFNALVALHAKYAEYDSAKISRDISNRFGEEAVAKQIISVYERL